MGNVIDRPHACGHENQWTISVFRQREMRDTKMDPCHDGMLNGESNIGKWTMRFTDFMEDLKEWELVSMSRQSTVNKFECRALGEENDGCDWPKVIGRAYQIIYRHRPAAADNA